MTQNLEDVTSVWTMILNGWVTLWGSITSHWLLAFPIVCLMLATIFKVFQSVFSTRK